jgi:hypothetical protein
MLVFNLALADLTISGFVDTLAVIGVFKGRNYFDERPVLCGFIGAICLIACETSLMNIGFLAINRSDKMFQLRLLFLFYKKNILII